MIINNMNDIELVVGIDVETIGSNVALHQLTEVGYAIVRVEDMQVIDKYSTFIPYVNGMTSEQRCLNEFWLKRDDKTGEYPMMERFKESLIGVQNAPYDAMFHLIQRLRSLTYGKKVKLIVDTAAFDGSWFNHYMPLPCPGTQDPTSIDYLFLDNEGKSYYNPPLQITPFFLGIGWKYVTKSPYLSACIALGIPPRSFQVKHDHHSENDALLLCLRFVYILKGIEVAKSNQ